MSRRRADVNVERAGLKGAAQGVTRVVTDEAHVQIEVREVALVIALSEDLDVSHEVRDAQNVVGESTAVEALRIGRSGSRTTRSARRPITDVSVRASIEVVVSDPDSTERVRIAHRLIGIAGAHDQSEAVSGASVQTAGSLVIDSKPLRAQISARQRPLRCLRSASAPRETVSVVVAASAAVDPPVVAKALAGVRVMEGGAARSGEAQEGPPGRGIGKA